MLYRRGAAAGHRRPGRRARPAVASPPSPSSSASPPRPSGATSPLLERAGMLRRVHGGAVPAGALDPGRARPRRAARHPHRGQAEDRRRGARPPARPPTAASSSTAAARPPRSPTSCRPTAALYVATNSVPIAARLSAVARHHAARARRPGPRHHPDRRRRRHRPRAGRPAGRRRLPRHQRHQRRARLHHPRRGRGRHQAGDGAGRASGSSCSPTAASSAASTWCASPAVEDVDVLVTDGEADPGVVAELETLGIEVVVA